MEVIDPNSRYTREEEDGLWMEWGHRLALENPEAAEAFVKQIVEAEEALDNRGEV